jgi:hypothetical protein
VRVLVLVYDGFGYFEPDYEGRAVAATADQRRFKVKRYWWSRGEWLPVNGPFCKLKFVEEV